MVMAGWGSDNRYALIGGLRSAAQAISYEIPLVVALLATAMLANSFNIAEIVQAQGRVPYIVWQPLGFLIFYIAMLAELNRTPFDIAVGESETAGGPHIEYSGIRWSMFFLAEYAALWIMALLGAAVFLGGPAWPLGDEGGFIWQVALTVVKSGLLIFSVFWVRATLPRMRVDQLMAFSWKVLLPLTFAQILVNGLVLVYDWPEVILLVQGVAGVAFLAWVIDRAVRQPRPLPVPMATATSEAAS
jgi:NADH-quinone oxidoreductase subunit H